MESSDGAQVVVSVNGTVLTVDESGSTTPQWEAVLRRELARMDGHEVFEVCLHRATENRATENRATDDLATDVLATHELAIDDRATGDGATGDRAVPDDTVPDETVPDDTVPDDTVPDDTRLSRSHPSIRAAGSAQAMTVEMELHEPHPGGILRHRFVLGDGVPAGEPDREVLWDGNTTRVHPEEIFGAAEAIELFTDFARDGEVLLQVHCRRLGSVEPGELRGSPLERSPQLRLLLGAAGAPIDSEQVQAVLSWLGDEPEVSPAEPEEFGGREGVNLWMFEDRGALLLEHQDAVMSVLLQVEPRLAAMAPFEALDTLFPGLGRAPSPERVRQLLGTPDSESEDLAGDRSMRYLIDSVWVGFSFDPEGLALVHFISLDDSHQELVPDYVFDADNPTGLFTVAGLAASSGLTEVPSVEYDEQASVYIDILGKFEGDATILSAMGLAGDVFERQFSEDDHTVHYRFDTGVVFAFESSRLQAVMVDLQPADLQPVDLQPMDSNALGAGPARPERLLRGLGERPGRAEVVARFGTPHNQPSPQRPRLLYAVTSDTGGDSYLEFTLDAQDALVRVCLLDRLKSGLVW